MEYRAAQPGPLLVVRPKTRGATLEQGQVLNLARIANRAGYSAAVLLPYGVELDALEVEEIMPEMLGGRGSAPAGGLSEPHGRSPRCGAVVAVERHERRVGAGLEFTEYVSCPECGAALRFEAGTVDPSQPGGPAAVTQETPE